MPLVEYMNEELSSAAREFGLIFASADKTSFPSHSRNALWERAFLSGLGIFKLLIKEMAARKRGTEEGGTWHGIGGRHNLLQYHVLPSPESCAAAPPSARQRRRRSGTCFSFLGSAVVREFHMRRTH